MSTSLEYPQNLLDAIFRSHGYDYEARPADFTGSLEYVLCSLNDERASAIIRLRYKDRCTYTEIGERFNLSGERVRQIIVRTLQRLRHPNRITYLQYGVEGKALRDAHALQEIAVARVVEAMKQKDHAQMLRINEQYHVETEEPFDPHSFPIERFNFSFRSYNALKRVGVNTLGDLLELTSQQLLYIRNIGTKSYNEIVSALAEMDYKLRS